MLKAIKRLVVEERGANMFEYAILLGVGAAAAWVLGRYLVPAIRNAVTRSSASLNATSGW